MAFIKWFFSKLPDYFKETDNYKDILGRGLLERYLLNFELELEDELYLFIRDFVNILDPQITPDKFLALIAYTLGNPLDVNGNRETYRKILRYAVNIYKIKGTIPSYKLLFNLLGLDVDIIEYDNPVNVRFDREFNFDIGLKFDQVCKKCGEYTVAYHNWNDECSTFTVGPVDPTLVTLLPKLVSFLEPIDAKLRNIARLIKFCETWEFGAEETFDITVIGAPTCEIPFNLTVG